MTTIRAFIVKSTKKGKSSKIRFRLTDGRDVKLMHTSEQYVSQELWDNSKEQCIKFKDKEKASLLARQCKHIEDFVDSRKALIEQIYNSVDDKSKLTSAIFERKIDKYLHPEKYETFDFFGCLEIYIREAKISTGTMKQFKVLKEYLKRFQTFTDVSQELEFNANLRNKGKKYHHFRLNLDTLNKQTIEDFTDYLKDEHLLFEEYPDVFARMGVTNEPKQRCDNTIVKTLRKLRTFIRWCNPTYTTNNPFGRDDKTKFAIDSEQYAEPISMRLEELKQLYKHDFGDQASLAVQRDIFIFQSMTGCRVSDLMAFTANNIDYNDSDYPDGCLKYVAKKTSRIKATSLKVPLNKTAIEIINRYKDSNRASLLPYISEQKYNTTIKRLMEKAGMDRLVSVRDKMTKEDSNKPLYSVASSHMARRNFYNCLYDQGIKDAVICAMSGHSLRTEGSSRRYHDVKPQLKIDAVRQLELCDERTERTDTSNIVEQLRSLSPEQLRAVMSAVASR
jgi:integrase